LLSIIYGIASALTWGAGDFAGGLASRKMSAYRGVFYADLFGWLILWGIALFYRETFPPSEVMWNAFIGGALGSFGLLVLYYSLSIGQMSIAAPVSALFAALLPVVYGAFTEGLPSMLQFIGFGLALLAVWLIAQGEKGFHVGRLADLRFPILAGVGFGLYFIFIHNAVQAQDALLWPLISSRTAGTAMLFVILLARRESFTIPKDARVIIWFSATLDLLGNFFYMLASRTGRIDIAAILSSLYPGATAILAWVVLKERVTRTQAVGILFAFLAIYFFTA
jgi:drug/metabolite transporter (DMT)-like permease